MKKIQDAGFRIAKCPCTITSAFGKSQFFNFRRLFKTGVDVMKLWIALVIRKDHRRTNDVSSSRTATSAPPATNGRPGLTVDAPAPAGGGDYQAYYRGRRVMITGRIHRQQPGPAAGRSRRRDPARRFADPDYGGNLYNIQDIALRFG